MPLPVKKNARKSRNAYTRAAVKGKGKKNAKLRMPAFMVMSFGKLRGLGGLKSLFGGNIKLPEFNADTILLLVMVYFLVSDDSENISDTLLIVGVLLLLGF